MKCMIFSTDKRENMWSINTFFERNLQNSNDILSEYVKYLNANSF